MKIYKLIVWAGICLLGMVSTQAQNGNQILDGIGETGLVARYVLDGTAKDWSRNNLHATIMGGSAAFVKDELFGEVLELPEDGKAYVTIPGEIFKNIESVSITGWVYLNSAEMGQPVFDFGKSAKAHLYITPFGTEDGSYEAVIKGKQTQKINSYVKVATGEWIQFALVVNTPAKSVNLYFNGKSVGEIKNADMELSELFDKDSCKKNLLYIAKSITAGSPNLKGKLHDIRIYRIPLSEAQINTIYNNAIHAEEVHQNPVVEESSLLVFDKDYPQLYNQYLTQVSDTAISTSEGSLPRLPRYLSGMYKDGIQGPKVRVLWPEPTDTKQVQYTGNYTIEGNVPGTDFHPKAIISVIETKKEPTPARTLETFELSQVTLDTDEFGSTTPFIENRDKFINTLAQTNPDAFLYMFRNAFGEPQPAGATPLEGWDTQETKLRGHATGHYLSAIAQAYASTGYDKTLQAIFATKMDYMVNTLYALAQKSGKPVKPGGEFVADPTKVPYGSGRTAYDSDLSEAGIRTDYWNWGAGFISAYPPDQFIMLENGATYGGQKTQIWAPYYTLHKILAGLMDVYEVSGNERALAIAKGMGNWVQARLSQLPTETLISMWNRYIAGEFGGMNEAMARLYRLTDDPKYLEVAKLFDNIRVFYGDANHTGGLAKNVDMFRGLHANQHIPQIMGALEMYRDSNNPDYFQIADNFWYKTTNDYMYSIGGVAGARNPNNAECFISQPASLFENGFSEGGQNETCGTYNMLKLTGNLFLYEPKAAFMDYYERGLYNHILASVAEDSPANTYHVPLRPGAIKEFDNAHMTGFTCCNGTALESSTKLQNTIYFRSADNSALYVNLFIASTLDWKAKGVTIQQITGFPKEDITRLKITGKGNFDLKIRVPQWATNGYFVTVNGKEEKVNAVPGSYLTLSRKWKSGDVVEIKMPFQFHLDPVMDQQNIASLFYGPILLAAQETEPRNDWRKITLNKNDIGATIKGDPKTLEFEIDGVVFKPFYKTYGRHSVYLDVTLQ